MSAVGSLTPGTHLTNLRLYLPVLFAFPSGLMTLIGSVDFLDSNNVFADLSAVFLWPYCRGMRCFNEV